MSRDERLFFGVVALGFIGGLGLGALIGTILIGIVLR